MNRLPKGYALPTQAEARALTNLDYAARLARRFSNNYLRTTLCEMEKPEHSGWSMPESMRRGIANVRTALSIQSMAALGAALLSETLELLAPACDGTPEQPLRQDRSGGTGAGAGTGFVRTGARAYRGM